MISFDVVYFDKQKYDTYPEKHEDSKWVGEGFYNVVRGEEYIGGSYYPFNLLIPIEEYLKSAKNILSDYQKEVKEVEDMYIKHKEKTRKLEELAQLKLKVQKLERELNNEG